MTASYHNHTTWSDGRASVAEVVAAAEALGLEELGISDHWVLDPRGETPSWSMDPAALDEYVADLRANGRGSSVPLRLGVEVDWFPDHADRIEAALAPHAFDYRIGSVHTVGGFRLDARPELWAALTVAERDDKHRRYWRALRHMAAHRSVDIVAHLDLPKKFGQQPTVDLRTEIEAALDAIAEADMAVELNTSGWHAPCRDAYPAVDLVRACRERGIPALLSADAHDPRHLVRDFDRGAERLWDAGYREIVRYSERRRSTVALA